MAAGSSIPLAVLCLLLLLLALVASAAVPATAGGKYSGASRMVIIRGGPATATRAGGGARSNNNRRQHYHRRLEDEVAPELGVVGGLLLGAGEGGGIGYGALDKDRPRCESGNQCAAKGPGGSYTRGCTYNERCPH